MSYTEIQSRLKIAAPRKLCRTKALCLGKKTARKGKGNGGGGAFPFPYPARPKTCSQANGFALQARKTNQLGRLKISQRTFQPGKRYGFYCCGFRLCFVKEEIRQLPRGRIPYYMNHKRKTHQKKKTPATQRQRVSVQKCNDQSQGQVKWRAFFLQMFLPELKYCVKVNYKI